MSSSAAAACHSSSGEDYEEKGKCKLFRKLQSLKATGTCSCKRIRGLVPSEFMLQWQMVVVIAPVGLTTVALAARKAAGGGNSSY
ncbi:unnamed protein product [Ilex paraguariensis]|uniref:Uncharacterized protein n=1 Tax=Ilex paraguariensis TaxID=185542 RepID=A0ABC8RRH9_9AQUA